MSALLVSDIIREERQTHKRDRRREVGGGMHRPILDTVIPGAGRPVAAVYEDRAGIVICDGGIGSHELGASVCTVVYDIKRAETGRLLGGWGGETAGTVIAAFCDMNGNSRPSAPRNLMHIQEPPSTPTSLCLMFPYLTLLSPRESHPYHPLLFPQILPRTQVKPRSFLFFSFLFEFLGLSWAR